MSVTVSAVVAAVIAQNAPQDWWGVAAFPAVGKPGREFMFGWDSDAIVFAAALSRSEFATAGWPCANSNWQQKTTPSNAAARAMMRPLGCPPQPPEGFAKRTHYAVVDI